jgi:hypothetical protein
VRRESRREDAPGTRDGARRSCRSGRPRFDAWPSLAEFTRFDSSGYTKIVWTLAAEPVGPAESVARTETRVVTTDPVSRARFRRYWAVVSPGIQLMRRDGLRLVRDEAERRYRALSATAASP